MAVIEAIATTYLEADAASVTFSSLGSYEHLQIRLSWRTTRASALERCLMQFNGDTGTNYSQHRMHGSGTTEGSSGNISQTGVFAAYWGPTSVDDATMYGSAVCDILDYRNGSKNTTTMASGGTAGMGTPYVTFQSGLWDNVAAVTSIVLLPGSGSDFTRGSEFTLYGLNSS